MNKTETVCTICPRECGGNRHLGENGYCGVSERMKVGRIAPHAWEEPCISGQKGSGAIFFAGCNMGCVFCQNQKLSRGLAGKEFSEEELAGECIKLQEMGCHNINLVTPSHYVLQIRSMLRIARKQGLSIPVVYNTSSYEKVEALRLLEGLVDIYLPDFKYLKEETAGKYSFAHNYPQVAKAALAEMVRQTGYPGFDENGMMTSGVLVRHLVLPEHVRESKEVIRYLYGTYGNRIYISIMNQYTPHGEVENFPELNRTVTEQEYKEVVEFAVELGVEQGFVQEGDTAKESFIPEFDLN